ncbi:MAG: hypothetical protein OEW47_00600 [Thermoleophilia bacterium]|nr:hypothetical protein [Thermoleophilia bacterium]
MTIQALLGLAVLNAFLLGVGIAMLWAIRGWRSWAELARLSGFAYMLGVALVGVTLSLELVLDVPFSLAAILVTGAALMLSSVAVRQLFARWRPASACERPRALGFVGAAFGLLVAIYLEALFRAGRLAGLSAWDAWAFWVPKAKAIYFFGGLDEQFFRELANPTYPPLLPALEASAFHFMGSPDVITLHVQFWFFACGFAGAVAGLLAPRVPGVVLGPCLLLVIVAPRVAGRNLDPQADFLLDYLFALAALLVALWLLDHEPWQLVSASLLLGAAMLTKREGLLLAACVIAAALVAGWRDHRYAWPRLGVAAAVAVAVAVPWRIWFSYRDLEGELPEAGFLGLFGHLDRAWPAFESVLSTVLDYELWLVIPALAAAGVVLAFIAGARVLPTFALVLYGLLIAGFTWVLWSFTELELPFVQDEGVNPIVRLTGSLVVVSGGLLPLLLDAAWRGGDRVTLEES